MSKNYEPARSQKQCQANKVEIIRDLFIGSDVRQKILPYGRKDIDQNHFLIQHRRPVPMIGREVQNVARGHDPFFSVEREFHFAPHHECHLFVRVAVGGRDHERIESKSTDHDVLTDDYLPVDALRDPFNGNGIPVGYQCFYFVCFT